MATVAAQKMPNLPQGPIYKPIIERVPAEAKPKNVEFDPAKHLAYAAPTEVIMMKDIGYSPDTGVSPVAVSQPFRLFSKEAVEQMRSEIFKQEVMESCSYRSNIAASQLRGYAPKYAPFTYDAWRHPDTLAIISKVAGVDLVPQMNFEIGHINFSVKTQEQIDQERTAIDKAIKRFEDEGISGCPWEDDKPVVGWHRDSYPFVCVLMLSDCTDMVGGETALRTATGEVIKVRGPEMGCAVVLQGRYITHQALRALGAKERITSVTSFRPRSPFVADDTVLTTVRPISNLSDLYYEFCEYRLELMEERIRAQLQRIRQWHRAGKKFQTKLLKQFLAEQEAFMAHTNKEIVEEEKVIKGYIEEVNLPDVVVGTEEKPSLQEKPTNVVEKPAQSEETTEEAKAVQAEEMIVEEDSKLVQTGTEPGEQAEAA